MDRMAQTALNSLKMIMENQTATSHNLANINTPGYKQHLNYASLRAIECRRAIARSANTGISAFIDSKGLITNATKWDEEIVIKSRLETNSIQTFYVRFGDYIGRISAFIAVMFLCFTLAKRN